jgi:hypothetical protein
MSWDRRASVLKVAAGAVLTSAGRRQGTCAPALPLPPVLPVADEVVDDRGIGES